MKMTANTEKAYLANKARIGSRWFREFELDGVSIRTLKAHDLVEEKDVSYGEPEEYTLEEVCERLNELQFESDGEHFAGGTEFYVQDGKIFGRVYHGIRMAYRFKD